MMPQRRPTRNERRMEELCRIRRPLTIGEQMDVKRLRTALYNTEWKRKRYANDPAFRETVRARVAAYKARRRNEAGG